MRRPKHYPAPVAPDPPKQPLEDASEEAKQLIAHGWVWTHHRTIRRWKVRPGRSLRGNVQKSEVEQKSVTEALEKAMVSLGAVAPYLKPNHSKFVEKSVNWLKRMRNEDRKLMLGRVKNRRRRLAEVDAFLKAK